MACADDVAGTAPVVFLILVVAVGTDVVLVIRLVVVDDDDDDDDDGDDSCCVVLLDSSRFDVSWEEKRAGSLRSLLTLVLYDDRGFEFIVDGFDFLCTTCRFLNLM